MTKQDSTRDQYLLRIKKGTPLDSIMVALDKSDTPLTNEQLGEIGGQKQWEYQFQWIAKMTDNVAVNKDWGANAQTMRYIKPTGLVPQAISAQAAPVQAIPDQQPQEALLWPDAPPLIESMGETFRTPDWFNTMREMVNRGRHIALSGPPGVGKDTAVQELAATQGHPLVTIGGDAGFRRKDIVGSLQIRNGQSYMEVAEYAAAVVNGWWALVTEVNAADADALLFINTQLAPPYVVNISGKSYPVHPDFRLFVSYNPGLVGTKPLPQSFKDRFFPIQVPFFSEYQLGRILTAHGMPEGTDWGTFITKFGVTLWEAHTRGQLRYQVTSRRLQDAVELMLSGVVDNPREAIRQAVIAAIDSSIEAKVAETVLDQQRWSVY